MPKGVNDRTDFCVDKEHSIIKWARKSQILQKGHKAFTTFLQILSTSFFLSSCPMAFCLNWKKGERFKMVIYQLPARIYEISRVGTNTKKLEFAGGNALETFD